MALVHGTSPGEAQAIARKIARYRGDFRSFAREQLKLAGNPFNPWPCQIPLLESMERQLATKGFVRTVWLKARQVGASTLAQGIVAWRTMLWPHTNAIVIADEAKRSESLYDISRSFYDNLDEDIKPVGRYSTKKEIVFSNPSDIARKRDPGLRSRIVIESAHKKNIAIGSNWQIAHLSECARFRDPSFVMDGIIPSVHRVPGTFLILESSAEMAGQWYRDFCEASMRGETAFEFQFVPWYLQPEYYICPICQKSFPLRCTDPEAHEIQGMTEMQFSADERHILSEFGLKAGHMVWMREKLSEMAGDWDLFRQNFPLVPDDAWVTPGAQVFPTKQLRELRAQVRPPIRRCEIFPGAKMMDSPVGRLQIWEEPLPGKSYDMAVDIASGIGRDDDENDPLDFSVMCVLERGSNKQVAEWASKAVDPFELASHLYSLGKYYNEAQIAVETNGIGGATNQQLAKMGYINQYVWRYRDEIVPRYSKKSGWETNPRSKPWLIGFTIHELMNGRMQIRSELLLKEMELFVRKGDREWGAVAGAHDDRVMAFMIALLTSDDENFERYYGLSKQMEDQHRKTPTGEPQRTPEKYECDSTFLKEGGNSYEASWRPWADEPARPTGGWPLQTWE